MGSEPCATARGQASVEHVGLVALVALALLAAGALAPRLELAGSVEAALCRALQGRERCGEAPARVRTARPDARRSRSDLLALVDRYMAADLEAFLRYRASTRRDPRLDFSTDRCSAPLIGSSGASFDFAAACLRHDFGYRNYARLGVFAARRGAVDARFLADMRRHCAIRPAAQRGRCRLWAHAYHVAVRVLGPLAAAPG